MLTGSVHPNFQSSLLLVFHLYLFVALAFTMIETREINYYCRICFTEYCVHKQYLKRENKEEYLLFYTPREILVTIF